MFAAVSRGRCRSEVPTALLLALDGLEERLEVALAEPLRAVAFDQLEEHRRPVLHRLGEDLQQIAVLVPVGEDAQLPQRADRYAGLAGPALQRVVVGAGGVEELHSGR